MGVIRGIRVPRDASRLNCNDREIIGSRQNGAQKPMDDPASWTGASPCRPQGSRSRGLARLRHANSNNMS